jgi:GTP-binding protein Era
MHKPRTKLGDYMVKQTAQTIAGVDTAILVVEAREAVGDIEANMIQRFKNEGIRAILVINKIDTVRPENIAKTIAAYAEAFDFEVVIPIAAKNGKGVDIVISECEKFLRESEWFFPDDIVTDQPERQVVSEIIREKLLRMLEEEIPHGTAVTIEEWKEEGNLVSIRAEIYCEKASHKGMIIGKQGSMLRQIGQNSRIEIENLLDTKVNLQLWVKVKKDWRDSDFLIKNFGYDKSEY